MSKVKVSKYEGGQKYRCQKYRCLKYRCPKYRCAIPTAPTRGVKDWTPTNAPENWGATKTTHAKTAIFCRVWHLKIRKWSSGERRRREPKILRNHREILCKIAPILRVFCNSCSKSLTPPPPVLFACYALMKVELFKKLDSPLPPVLLFAWHVLCAFY